jgi:hypothetical protein
MRRTAWVGVGIVASALLVSAVVASALSWPQSTPSNSPSGVSRTPELTSPAATTTAPSIVVPTVSPEPETAAPQPSAVSTSTPSPDQGADDESRPPVDVIITVARWSEESSRVEIGGYVAGLVEEGGSCTATLTLGHRTVVVSGEAFADVSTTSCGDLVVTADQISTGAWSAVLSYGSTTHSGSSAHVSIGVP